MPRSLANARTARPLTVLNRRDGLRALITPEKPPRPTRDGDLPIGLKQGAALGDHIHQRAIEITSGVYGNGALAEGEHATIIVRWESSTSEGVPTEELAIGGMGAFRCEGEDTRIDGAVFTAAHPHVIRGLATLLTELADRVEADHAAYASLAQARQ